jgi:hypothetical protein
LTDLQKNKIFISPNFDSIWVSLWHPSAIPSASDSHAFIITQSSLRHHAAITSESGENGIKNT